MTDATQKISVEGLAKILLIQSMVSQLPEEDAIFDFVCRGLEDMPGVGRAHYEDLDEKDGVPATDRHRFPLQLQGKKYGEIVVDVDDGEQFLPYLTYIENLCFTIAVVLEERRLRHAHERHHLELERQVRERTRQLTEQVREREAAEKRAIAEKIRAERYLDVAEAITIELDPQCRIELINRWGCRLLGYSPDELIGRDWVETAVPADQREAIREKCRNIFSGGRATVEYAENEIVTRSGERRRIAWHSVLRCTEEGRKLGLLGFGLDITERKEAEEALRTRQGDLDHAQAVAHIGNWRLNIQRNELVWSDEVYRIFGVDKRIQPTYELFLGFVHPNDRAFVDKQWGAALRGKPYDIDHRILVDGVVKWVREKAELEFNENGKLLGGFGTVQDITDRKRLEFDLLSSMRAAEEANRIKSQFLANMSHELRTPLTVIMGALQLVNTNVAPPERQRLLEMADGSADQLLQIISDLLDFSHLDAGRLKIEEQPCALQECVERAVEMFASSAREKGIQLESAISPDLPPRIAGDPARIEQILMNLVGNAVKFTDRGRISVAAARQDGKILFTVRDTGIGIPPEKMEQLFDPFTQVDGSMTRHYGGTGLGLAISKELVELMGGRIRVESKYGRGSTFSFTLPLKDPQYEDEVESPREAEEQSGAIRVLLAEDEPAVRDLVKIILNRRGLEVIGAENGLEALALWDKGKFDLILMDIQMPEMDGLEATRKIRETEQGRKRKTCIFALTAHARPEDREECLKAGMDGFLTKPIQMDELNALIQKFGPNSGPVCGLSGGELGELT